MFALGCLVFSLPGTFLLLLFKPRDYPHIVEQEDKRLESVESEYLLPKQMREKVGLLESLKVFRDIYFWALMWSFFAGIGSSVYVLTHAAQLWSSYNHILSLSDWGGRILVIFSFVNAGSNVFCGILSDFLATRSILARHHFVAIVQIVYATVFAVLGILFEMGLHHHTNTVAVAIILALCGMLFIALQLFKGFRLWLWSLFGFIPYYHC